MNILSQSVYNYVNEKLRFVKGNFFEIGVFNGTGLAQVAANHPDKICYAVDPFIEDGHTVASSGIETGNPIAQQLANCLENIKNLKNVNLYQVTSKQFFNNLTSEEITTMNIGLSVIDGNHHYDHVVNDLELCLSLLEKRSGYILVDDVDVPDVNRAYQEFKEKYHNRISDDESAGGATRVLFLKSV